MPGKESFLPRFPPQERQRIRKISLLHITKMKNNKHKALMKTKCYCGKNNLLLISSNVNKQPFKQSRFNLSSMKSHTKVLLLIFENLFCVYNSFMWILLPSRDPCSFIKNVFSNKFQFPLPHPPLQLHFNCCADADFFAIAEGNDKSIGNDMVANVLIARYCLAVRVK